MADRRALETLEGRRLSFPEELYLWCNSLGFSGDFQAQELTGGNNRALMVRIAKQTLLFKCYRDRTRAEREFQVLQFLVERRFTQVPRPLALHDEHPWTLQEFIRGRQPRAADLVRGAQEALAFLTDLRALGQVPLALASDSYESASNHLENLRRRIEKLPPSDLEMRWQELYALPLPPEIEPQDRWLSPSDFGFHNALVRRDGSFCFFDLEYAGVDEASKIICDFFCQPQLPAPLTAWDSFVALLSPSARARLPWMWKVTTCKWACIILKPLSEPQPLARARRDPESQFKKLRWLERRRRQVEGNLAPR